MYLPLHKVADTPFHIQYCAINTGPTRPVHYTLQAIMSLKGLGPLPVRLCLFTTTLKCVFVLKGKGSHTLQELSPIALDATIILNKWCGVATPTTAIMSIFSRRELYS